MRAAGVTQVGTAGYGVAQAMAEANLLLGRSVVADCVNPVRENRLAWREVAARSSARLLDIYLVCTDAEEHRRRVEGRTVDVPGLAAPTWEAVRRHEFEERDDDPLRLDTATLTAEELIARCEAAAKS